MFLHFSQLFKLLHSMQHVYACLNFTTLLCWGIHVKLSRAVGYSVLMARLRGGSGWFQVLPLRVKSFNLHCLAWTWSQFCIHSWSECTMWCGPLRTSNTASAPQSLLLCLCVFTPARPYTLLASLCLCANTNSYAWKIAGVKLLLLFLELWKWTLNFFGRCLSS